MILLKCCKNVVVFFETILTEKFTTKYLIVQTNSSVNTKLSNSNLRN